MCASISNSILVYFIWDPPPWPAHTNPLQWDEFICVFVFFPHISNIDDENTIPIRRFVVRILQLHVIFRSCWHFVRMYSIFERNSLLISWRTIVKKVIFSNVMKWISYYTLSQKTDKFDIYYNTRTKLNTDMSRKRKANDYSQWVRIFWETPICVKFSI